MAGRLQQLAREVRKRAPRKRTLIWASSWVQKLAAPDPPEGYSLVAGRFHTLRRGAHVVTLFCSAPPTPQPTHAALLAALEERLSQVIAEYPAKLAAELAQLRKLAADRGITLPTDVLTPSPAADLQAGDMETDR